MHKDEIRSIRQSMGLTQEQFAMRLGTCFTSVNRWENGRSKASRLYIKEIRNIAPKSKEGEKNES